MDVISRLKDRYERLREEELSLEDYLAECKRNPLAFATAAERMLKAIGEPQMVDTRNELDVAVVDEAQMLMVQTAKDLSAKGEIGLADNKGDDQLVY